jgi:hypothetical protein
MTSSNLALMFAPNLMRTPGADPTSLMRDGTAMCKYETFFYKTCSGVHGILSFVSSSVWMPSYDVFNSLKKACFVFVCCFSNKQPLSVSFS